MGRAARILIVLCSALLVAQSLMLCAATGWRSFTRFPDDGLRQMHDQEGSLSSLFPTASDQEPPRLIANEFSFGLLPSPTLSAEAVSVATVGGPALLAGLVALISGRRPGHRSSKENAS
jgi:hypothetical protein